METAILEAEAHREALGERLADSALYAGPSDEVRSVTDAFRQASERVDALYARWEELEGIRAD
ncbi:MAG: hypothetical protein M3409_11200 [Gemmatimonadota bacterium]|nr:hypothetical protein [Gemmatimonadota bacterium]